MDINEVRDRLEKWSESLVGIPDWPCVESDVRSLLADHARLQAVSERMLHALECVLHDSEDLDMIPSNEPGRDKTAFELVVEAVEAAKAVQP